MPLIRGKQITSGEITSLQLGTNSVTTIKITDLNVTRAKIALLAVDTPQLEGGAVTSAKVDATFLATIIRTDGSEGSRTADMDMTSFKITSLADPTAAQDAATKAYVDALSAGLDPKESCRVATTAALPANTAAGSGVGKTLTADANGVLTIDGVATVLNDRLLIQDEATGANNGIYDVTTEGTAGVPFVLTRATDADEDIEVTAGMFTFIEEGTVNDNNGFVLATNNPITVDTTALVFSQFSGAGQIIPGTGMTKSGNTLNVNGGVGITANATDLDFDATEVDGDGLLGTGTSLAVQPNNTDDGGVSGLETASNGVRIAATAAGAGLAGGGGTTLSVGAGAAITVAADTVAVNPAGLIDGGAAEIDGDLIAVSQVPTNYTRSTSGEATALDQVAAHFQGIDDEIGTLSGAGTPAQESVATEVITTDQALADTLNSTPISNASVSLFLNGVHQRQGATFDYTISGSTITWLASSGTAVDMDTADILIAIYEV